MYFFFLFQMLLSNLVPVTQNENKLDGLDTLNIKVHQRRLVYFKYIKLVIWEFINKSLKKVSLSINSRLVWNAVKKVLSAD